MSNGCKTVLLCVLICALASLFDAGLLVRLVLEFVTLAAILWTMIFGRALAHPAEALIVSWAIPWSSHFLHLFYFGHDWPQKPLLYVAMFLGSYLLGFYLDPETGKARGGLRKSTEILRPHSIQGSTRIYDLCAVLGCVSAFAALRWGVSSIGGDYQDLGAVRDAFTSNPNVSAWAYVVLLTSPGGIIAYVAALLYQEELSSLRRLSYILAGFLTVTSGVVQAGRYMAVLVTGLTLICMALRRRARKRVIADKRLAWMLAAIVTVLAAYMLILPSLRDTRGRADYAAYASKSVGVEVDDGLQAPLTQMNSTLRVALYASYAYLAMPLENVRIFYEVYSGTPAYGGLEESLIARQMKRVFPQIKAGMDILEERYEENAAAGEASTSWQTMARDAVIDFGWSGALIFAFVLGLLGRVVFRNAISSGSIRSVFALVALCFISFHSIMYSIIGDLNILVLLGWGWILSWAKVGFPTLPDFQARSHQDSILPNN
jgi:hypothetical protein